MDASRHQDLRVPHDGWILFAILAAAFFLRIWSVDFGLPYLYHADEPIVVNHALAYGAGDLNPHFFKIPPLISYLLFGCYGFYFAIGRAAGLFASTRDLEQFFYADPSSFYLIARGVFGVLLGTASVYLLYRLVKRFWDPRAALWASFFLAVNFLHVRDSHYIYADIPLVFVLLLGMTVILTLVPPAISERSHRGSNAEFPPETRGNDNERRTSHLVHSSKPHLLVGVIIGLATAVKYNGLFLAIPYAWVCVRNVPLKKWLSCWILVGLGAGVGVLTAARARRE